MVWIIAVIRDRVEEIYGNVWFKYYYSECVFYADNINIRWLG